MLIYNPDTDIMASPDITPEQMGRQACLNGESVFDYPFDINTKECTEWIDGFCDQDRQIGI